MKILMLAHAPLFPEQSGQRVRTASILRSLRTRHDVVLLAPGNTNPGNSLPCPDSRPSRAAMGLAWFAGTSVWKERFVSRSATEAIGKALRENFDLVVCAGLPSAFRLPSDTRSIPVWLDEQNVEWRIVERAAALRGGLAGWAVRREATKLRQAESSAVGLADFVTTCSRDDASLLGKGEVLPNPASAPPDDFRRIPACSSLLFSGTLCWGPNVDAARWMAETILPRIRRIRPKAVLRLVGRDPSPEVRALGSLDGVKVVGTVESMWDELSNATVSVAPIRMGSGTRIKILEATMSAAPVVSTTIGAEGLDFRHGKEILLADDPDDFAKACLDLLSNSEKADEMGCRARLRCEQLYGPARFQDRVLELADLAIRSISGAA